MIATCFNEPNNEIVWSESLVLARDMLKYWSERTSIATSADDLRSLSLHILASAGFGKSSKWEGPEERARSSVSGDYKDSLRSSKVFPCFDNLHAIWPEETFTKFFPDMCDIMHLY